jgi:hypothetical protein
MVTLFDKLLVLSSTGGLSYFGPVDRSVLREIFTLGSTNSSSSSSSGGTTSSTANDDPESNSRNKNDESGNSSSSIADLVLEASLDKTGRSEDEIKRRYMYSSTAQLVTTAITQCRVQITKGTSIYDCITPNESNYPNTFTYRFQLIIERRVKLITRNSVTWTRMIIAILFGLVIGSLFAKSPNTLGGALSKVSIYSYSILLSHELSNHVLHHCRCNTYPTIPHMTFPLHTEWLHLPTLLHRTYAIGCRNTTIMLP